VSSRSIARVPQQTLAEDPYQGWLSLPPQQFHPPRVAFYPPPPSPTPLHPPPPPPPRRPQQRHADARLPPPRPDGDCITIPHATDRRLRININKELRVFNESPSTDVDLYPQTRDQTRKRKNREWVEVEYTGTLGTRPRDFVSRLAIHCAKQDVHEEECQWIVLTNTACTTSSLISLAAAHARYSHDDNMTRFWQSIIEIQIALLCERFVYYLFGHPRIDRYGVTQCGKEPQGYLGSLPITFTCEWL